MLNIKTYIRNKIILHYYLFKISIQKNEGDENGGGGERCDFRFEDLVKDVLKIWVLQAQYIGNFSNF